MTNPFVFEDYSRERMREFGCGLIHLQALLRLSMGTNKTLKMLYRQARPSPGTGLQPKSDDKQTK